MLNIGGLPTDFAKQAFYGFRLNPLTGGLTIEVIFNGNGVVSLPSESEVKQDDYKQWLWSDNTLEFNFNSSGHLEMTVL